MITLVEITILQGAHLPPRPAYMHMNGRLRTPSVSLLKYARQRYDAAFRQFISAIPVLITASVRVELDTRLGEGRQI